MSHIICVKGEVLTLAKKTTVTLLFKPTSSFHSFLMYPLLLQTQKGIQGPSLIPVLVNDFTFFDNLAWFMIPKLIMICIFRSSWSLISFMLDTKFSMGSPKKLDINQSVIEKDSIYLWKNSKFWYGNIYYSHIDFGKWSLACSGAKHLHDFFAQASDQNLESYFSIPSKTASTHRELLKSTSSLKLSCKGAGIAS